MKYKFPETPKIVLENYLDLLINEKIDSRTVCPVCLEGISGIINEIHDDLKTSVGRGITKFLRKKGFTSAYYAWKADLEPVPIWKIKKLLNIWRITCKKSDEEYKKFYNKVFETVTEFRAFKSPVGVKVQKYLTPELAYLIGNLYADGSLRNIHLTLEKEGRYRYEITTTDESREYIDFLCESYKRVFGINTSTKSVYDKWYRLLFYSLILHRFFNKIFEMPMGYKKGKLKIPKIIHDSPIELKKYFLLGFFDGDGSCTKIKEGKISPIIHVAQADSKILIEIQELLKEVELEFKLHKKRRDKYTWYMLETKSKSIIKKYHQKIGFLHPDKKKRLDWLVQKLDLELFSFNFLWQILFSNEI